MHYERQLLATDIEQCMFKKAKVGLKPPIVLDACVYLPHVLTSLHKGKCILNQTAWRTNRSTRRLFLSSGA